MNPIRFILVIALTGLSSHLQEIIFDVIIVLVDDDKQAEQQFRICTSGRRTL